MDDHVICHLVVAGAGAEDAGRGVGRIDPVTLVSLGGITGALLALKGERTAYVRALPNRLEKRGKGLIHIDSAARANAQVKIGDRVTVALGGIAVGLQRIKLHAPPGSVATALRRILTGIPLNAGDTFRFKLNDGSESQLTILATEPDGPGLVQSNTSLEIVARAPAQQNDSGPRYEDVGGLSKVIDRIREVVELPLRHRAMFTHLGVTPPRGILLVGPPGTGKTMIARAVAAETGAHFITINAPEIVDRFYGASEQHLRQAFETARKRAPSIIFIDEIDAIAQKRDALSGEKQVERRIVAQLLTLMDGLAGRGEVVVLAATNLPDGIDPALRRPGRFDREIRVDPPDRNGRREILAVHTRSMPLAADVMLDDLAAATHGHVGADLAALCREAAMTALRRRISPVEYSVDQAIALNELSSLRVHQADFRAALREIRPTALREVFVEVPNVRWHDVAGVDSLRIKLERAVQMPLAEPERFARWQIQPPRGVLLHGRPGTGKTLLARALATEAQANFISVRGPELLAEWQGASERALREVFARARMAAPCIIFFDEIDAIASRRGSQAGATVERMVAQLLTEMDGINQPVNVVVLAATNRLELIDPALLRPGRFDLVLEMPVPDQAGRLALLTRHTRAMPIDASVDLQHLAQTTDNFVGADIAGLCRLAAMSAMGRMTTYADAGVRVTAADFAIALQEYQERTPQI